MFRCKRERTEALCVQGQRNVWKRAAEMCKDASARVVLPATMPDVYTHGTWGNFSIRGVTPPRAAWYQRSGADIGRAEWLHPDQHTVQWLRQEGNG